MTSKSLTTLCSLSLVLCSCASERAKKPTPAPAPKHVTAPTKHPLDVPLEELSIETHKIPQHILEACRKERISQACHDLAQTLEKNHRYTAIDAFLQAEGIACDGLIPQACESIGRPAPATLAPACSHKDNIKPDGTSYSKEERKAINQRYFDRNKAAHAALHPDFSYCAVKAAYEGAPYEGYIRVQFHINKEGRARVTRIAPEIQSEVFRRCFVSVLERASFTPHDPLVCAYYYTPYTFTLTK